jgi:imidazolonepropionase-like amidohydrolase
MPKGQTVNKLILILFAASTLQAQPQDQPQSVLYKAAAIHTADKGTIRNGQMLVTDGIIQAVGQNIRVTRQTKIVDLGNLQLYPGLIAATTSLGLAEINAVRATQDTTEVGEFTPDVEAWVSVNPDSELIPVARANGFTHALVAPMGGTITGASGLIKLAGWGVEDMTVKTHAALHLWWPVMTLNTRPKETLRDPDKYKSPKEQTQARDKKLKTIDEFFDEAEAYARARKAGGADFKKVPAWEGMLSALPGKQPIMVHANEVRQIKTAVAWAKRRKFKIVLAASRDSWQVADLLAKEKVPVIFDNVFTLPQRDTDPHDIHFRAAGILHKAGVKVAHSEPMGSWGASRVRNIVYAAAQSMAYGLPREAALRSLTLHPAQMLGVADRLGSLTPKKEATFIAVNGDVFDIRANVKHMWIAGKKISLQSRHTRLYEKYKNRPKPIK